MSHSERCPVCYGSGKVTPPQDTYSTAVPQPIKCYGCGGLGWVVVDDGRIVSDIEGPAIDYMKGGWVGHISKIDEE